MRPAAAVGLVVAAVAGFVVGFVLWLGPSPAAGQTPAADATQVDSATVTGNDTRAGETRPDNTQPGQPQDGAAPPNGSQPGEPVPCEVAMVVGCVATVEGENGTSTVTLRLDGTGEPTDGADEEDDRSLGELAADEQRADDRPLQSGLDPWERGGLRANFGTDSIPISHYQIGADVTGWLGVPDPLDSFVASQTNWAFTTSTFLVILATNALDWAFEFPLAEDLIGDAGVLAQNYSVDFFGFGLSTSIYSLALSVTMVVAGFKAVTRGVIVAGTEVVLAFVAYVTLIVLTLTSGFGNAGLSVARLSSDLSSGIASFAAGQERQDECAGAIAEADGAETAQAGDGSPDDGNSDDAALTSSACTFGFAIQRSLVELPYQNLQWGQVLDGVSGKEECAAINLELLAEGPWGNNDEPRDRMRAVAACEENADFNHEASYIRLGIASANTVAAAAVTLLILAVSAMLLWQQIKLLFLTVTMPHALVFAILPGRSRRVAWLWVEHLVGVVIRAVVLSLGLVVWLSLFSLIVHEQLTIRGIFLSLFASMAMAISGFYGLYRLGSMSRRINPAADRGPGRPPTGPVSGQTITGGSRTPSLTRRVASGAQTTLRTVGRQPRISGGPGDRPGGGAAAPPAPRPSPSPTATATSTPSSTSGGIRIGRGRSVR
ncbi:MAG: hypothetical protein AAGA65_15735 [Actinomycetota bacterium]